jgi:hypothetical protein
MNFNILCRSALYFLVLAVPFAINTASAQMGEKEGTFVYFDNDELDSSLKLSDPAAVSKSLIDQIINGLPEAGRVEAQAGGSQICASASTQGNSSCPSARCTACSNSQPPGNMYECVRGPIQAGLTASCNAANPGKVCSPSIGNYGFTCGPGQSFVVTACIPADACNCVDPSPTPTPTPNPTETPAVTPTPATDPCPPGRARRDAMAIAAPCDPKGAVGGGVIVVY